MKTMQTLKTRQFKRSGAVFALVLLACLLSGCGFKLRGALNLPVDIGPIEVIASSRYSVLANQLASRFEQQGAYAEVLPRPSGDLAVLRLISERWAATPISVDQFGRSQEYSLRYAVFFELRDAQGELVVPQQGIELSRDYTAPPETAMGTLSEREILEDELQREMVAAIMRRMNAVMQAKTATESTTTDL